MISQKEDHSWLNEEPKVLDYRTGDYVSKAEYNRRQDERYENGLEYTRKAMREYDLHESRKGGGFV
ncbi:MAG: hypothetical protein SP1CHLAM54_06310 [Chlamydiia bacterium]|nr:hypothetical protein [Chlamydiia bacterium]MCH9615541.1 hypothetical protein [Chlamydiia bacterium]MCH9629196.1 hypothetical protein [Chlamydiia bacterium]